MSKQQDTLSRLVDKLEDELDIKNEQIKKYSSQVEELSRSISNSQVLLDQQQKLNAHALLTGQNSEHEEKKKARKIKEYYEQKYIKDIKEIARILDKKYPGAVDYIIEQAEKNGG